MPLLAPEQQYFLRENIRLQLLAARLALLRGDRQIYRDSLQQARDWLLHHFDINQQATRWMLDELEQLADIDPRPDLPDISGSMRSLATATGAAG
jgi:uroporphyrin-3 C-methyltransferase